MKRGNSLVASGPRARRPDRTARNHEALISSWRGRDRYPPPPPAETRFDPQGQGASQPMLPARSVPAPGPQQRWLHGFIFVVNPFARLGAGLRFRKVQGVGGRERARILFPIFFYPLPSIPCALSCLLGVWHPDLLRNHSLVTFYGIIMTG